MAAVGFGVNACAPKTKPNVTPRRAPLTLPPVKASWDRIIRTTVGLRPHRDAGFVLKPDKLDDKLLVHNYGHGGAGMSLAWGTGLMAAEFATEHQARQAAVIGCGSVGLTCARQLQRRGFDVTIYAAAVPPNVTSNMSLAGFTPASGLVETDRRTPEWDAQYRRAADISYRQLQLLAGPHFGVSWLDNYSLADELPQPQPGTPERPNLNAGLNVGREIFGPGEHPFPTKYAILSPQIRIEPSIYLDNLMRDFTLFGGRIIVRKFDTPRDLAALREPIVINCTGLGARDLFGDQELVPLKGQLTVMVPQPEVNYHTNGGVPQPRVAGGLGIHMMARSDGIILGGTSQRGVWTLEPDEDERKRVVDSHIAVFSAMHPPSRRS
jgi:glycine/D-amino acid oxidase-like deaminating enzyme